MNGEAIKGEAAARASNLPGWASLIHDDGSAGHPHLAALSRLTDADAARSAADALHHLGTVHGRHPGVIDHAALRVGGREMRQALHELAESFARERDYLAQLAVAAGPLPSTPGHAETMSSVVAGRHAIDMLAQSERQGVAVGAALALALDWHAIRPALDAAAARFGVPVAPMRLPVERMLIALSDTACPTPATQRALSFGAQQIASQHRGLLMLLEARARARLDH